MVTIGVDQLISNSAVYEHIFLEILRSYTNNLANVMIYSNIKPLLKRLINNIPITIVASGTLKKLISRKLPSQLLTLFDVRKLLSADLYLLIQSPR